MQQELISGLHHVTALASNPQRNVDFYSGILGLRFIKKTINFDAPDVYHLYYGDAVASPGSIMTFFPYQDLPKGRKGVGQLTYTSFAIPQESLSFWMDRLTHFQIPFSMPAQRFNETYISFEDFDGLGVELVTIAGQDKRQGFATATIPEEYAIKGFHTVTLNEMQLDKTLKLLLETMQHRIIAESDNRYRLASGAGESGSFVDIVHTPTALRGLQGAGTVHHVAFATQTDDTQALIREKLLTESYQVTPIIDRNYFHSIYFREPGNILFEIATNPPGFAVDEPLEALGQKLQLPPWYQKNRQGIEQNLMPIEVKYW